MLERLLIISILLLSACSDPEPQKQRIPTPDPWSHEAEEIFQNAEALKYAIEQHDLEQQRLQEMGLEGKAPVPVYKPDEE